MTGLDVEQALHIRTETDCGPDYCRHCSETLQDWVPWPCPSIVSLTEWHGPLTGPEVDELVASLRASVEAARKLRLDGVA